MGPKPKGQCVIWCAVEGLCSHCGVFCQIIHLPGGRRGYCSQCCPICGDPQDLAPRKGKALKKLVKSAKLAAKKRRR